MNETIAARFGARPTMRRAAGWIGPLALVGGLAAIVGARWLATRAGLDPLLVGGGFGLALLVLCIGASSAAVATSTRPRLRGAGLRRALPRLTVMLAIGAAFGLALVAVASLGQALSGTLPVPGLGRPAAPLLPWAGITVLVATGEEVLLRGILLDRLERVGGIALAILLTSVVFALMHVPLYGWHVVPLDLAVGLGLAGLAITTRSLIAPVAAHTVADLATWWL